MNVSPVLVALVVGLGVAAGSVLVLAAFLRPRPRSVVTRPTATKPARVSGQRLAMAAVVAFVVLLLSQWLVAAIVAGVLVAVWGSVFRSKAAARDRHRLEAIAKWLEDVRDVVAGSNLSLEQALEQTAGTPPSALAGELSMFLAQRRRLVPLDDSLVALADALDHPTADSAISAMLLAIGASSGATVHRALAHQADVARDEVTARTRSDRIRSSYESTMRRLIVISIGIVVVMRLMARDLLSPLFTPAGQLWLIVPVAVWVGAIVWLRSLAGYELPRRYRLQRAFQEVRL